MSLVVVDLHGLATLQDAGRRGWRRFGVPLSGPMDPFAFQAANALVGNSGEFAAIEIGLGEAVFQAARDCVLGVTGVGYELSVYLWGLPLWGSFFVRAGWRIHLRRTEAGMWAYLAAAGGFQTDVVLGSRSTYLRGGLGGLAGRPLQAGDVIEMTAPAHRMDELAARTLPAEARPSYSDRPTLDVIPGPQTDRFSQESLEAFFSGAYTVSAASDRMGYRLEGPRLTQRGGKELISEGMTFGAIQVPPDGSPIVMMADCPSTGGYPKIATVASADLPLLAQCMPGNAQIRFRPTTVAAAQQKHRALLGGLQKIAADE